MKKLFCILLVILSSSIFANDLEARVQKLEQELGVIKKTIVFNTDSVDAIKKILEENEISFSGSAQMLSNENISQALLSCFNNLSGQDLKKIDELRLHEDSRQDSDMYKSEGLNKLVIYKGVTAKGCYNTILLYSENKNK